MTTYDLIIIGAGPAGLTAGLYSGRYRLSTVILEKMLPGGQIITSATIDNFPGFPAGTSTQELIERMKAQVEEVGVSIEQAAVQEITLAQEIPEPHYRLRCEDKEYSARSLIIASGAYPRKLNVAGEDKFIGRGVSYCATCDGPLFKNKEITVIGGGDRALEEALYLSNYASRLSLVHRRGQLRGSKILEEKARDNPKIKFILESVVEEICGEKKVDSLRLKKVSSGEKIVVPCQGVFIFVGMIPNTDFLKLFLQLDDSGFIITDQSLKTSREGVFACGDVLKKSLYQVITACGEAACASNAAFKYLMNR